MLARGNSSASANLRRAKSTISVKCPEAATDLPHVDPETARRDALAAASRAFDRAQSRTLKAARSANNLGVSNLSAVDHGKRPNMAQADHGKRPAALHKKQSIRFPEPPPNPDRIEPVPTLESIGVRLNRPSMDGPILRSHDLSQDALTALPEIQPSTTDPSTTATIRKVKSLFALRKPPSGVTAIPPIPNRDPSSDEKPSKFFTS